MSLNIVTTLFNSTGATPATSLSITSVNAIVGDILAIGASARAIDDVPTGTFNIAVSGIISGPVGNAINVGGTISLFGPPDLTSGGFYFIITANDTYTVTITTNVATTKDIIGGVSVVRGAVIQVPQGGPNASGSASTSGTTFATTNALSVDFVTINTNAGDIARVGSTQLFETTTSGFPGGMRTGGFSRLTPGSATYVFNTTSTGYITASLSFAPLIVCVAKDTEVLMADGTIKPIQYVQRGDLVAGDLDGRINRVARVIATTMPGITPVSIVKMARDSLGFNQPSQELILSSGHPVLYGDRRYRAKCFRGMPGVKYYSSRRNTASKLLPRDDFNESYTLYNLQFEHDGYFVANGVVVDSVPVHSDRCPLPLELYFNSDLYNVVSENDKPELIKKI